MYPEQNGIIDLSECFELREQKKEKALTLQERLLQEAQTTWVADLKAKRIDPDGQLLELELAFRKEMVQIAYLKEIYFQVGSVEAEIISAEQTAEGNFRLQLRPIQLRRPWWKFWLKKTSRRFFAGLSFDHAPRLALDDAGELQVLRPAGEGERTLKIWTAAPGETYKYVIDPAE